MKKYGFISFVLVFILSFSVMSSASVNTEALFLSNAGIMVGSNGDLDLDGTFTVEQLMTVLSRLQDAESTAKSYSTVNLFKDVPKSRWSAPYIAWAKATGISKGNPDGTIGYLDAVTTQRLCAFLLRTMGYADVAWDDVYSEAAALGLLDTVDVGASEALTRGDVAKMVYQALEQPTYEGGSLGDSLGLSKILEKDTLSAAEISKLVSPAVVYIETYDASGYMLASGSGFILTPNGKIGTNFHVIEGAASIVVKLIDGSVYEVANVAGYDAYRDVAVIEVSGGSNLPTVKLGNSDLVVNGEDILTIGSPIGLENTISDGLVSNTGRYVEELLYFQISAPISSGSSGGVLLNAAGEVIGITSASYLEGQNLNLAIPINEAKIYFESEEKYALADLFDSGDYEVEADYSEYEYIYYDDGAYYYGMIYNGIPEGDGTMYYANGDSYYGNWTDGEVDGIGEYYWYDGDYYSGDWIMGLRTGFGYYMWPDESSYYGYFMDNYMHGYGTMRMDETTYYSGEFEYDELVREFPVPQNLTAKILSNDSVKLIWSPVEEAESYYIYYSYDGSTWYYMDYSETPYMTTEWSIVSGEHLYFYVTGLIDLFETGSSEVVDVVMN